MEEYKQTFTMKIHFRMCVVLALGVIFSILSIGCYCDQEERSSSEAPTLQILDEVNFLIRSYLDATEPQMAKESVHRSIELLKSMDFPGSETEIWLSYGRLSSIESRHGDRERARIYYEKARYWLLIASERAKHQPGAIMKRLDSFSPEECERYVIEWDTGVNRGMVARHMEPSFPGSAQFRMAREAADSGEHQQVLSFLQEAVELGHKEARFELALLLRSGNAGGQDFKRIAALYRQLATEGDDRIRVALAELYEIGQGVEKDLVMALKWYKLADMSGDPRAPARISKLEAQLSPPDCKAAEMKVQQFLDEQRRKGRL
jgi:hypothetical protein